MGVCYDAGMTRKLMLFETESEQCADGSLKVKPRTLLIGEEIGVKKAAEMLGYRDKEAIYRLIEIRALKAWKPETANGNGKWRIDLQSVLEYKARRLDCVGND